MIYNYRRILTYLLPSIHLTPHKLDIPFLILATFVGLVSSTLINYFADVLPHTRQLARPVCPACDQVYPLKDYLLVKKCPNCGHTRPARTFIVLITTVLISLIPQFYPFAGLNFWTTFPLLIFLGTILVIDIEHKMVLWETSLVGLVLCLVYGVILRGWGKTLLGGLGGLLIMLAFYLIGVGFSILVGKLQGKKIKEVAFGFGDVAAGTFLGLLTGWPGIVGAIIIAILAFTAFTIPLLLGLIITKKYSAFNNAQPFVPFLILGTIILFYL